MEASVTMNLLPGDLHELRRWAVEQATKAGGDWTAETLVASAAVLEQYVLEGLVGSVQLPFDGRDAPAEQGQVGVDGVETSFRRKRSNVDHEAEGNCFRAVAASNAVRHSVPPSGLDTPMVAEGEATGNGASPGGAP